MTVKSAKTSSGARTFLTMALGLVILAAAGCASPSGTVKDDSMAASPASAKATAVPVASSAAPANAPAAASADKALTRQIPADDPGFRYVGRVDFKDPKAPAFSYPGVLITARFEGTGVDLLLGDTGNRDWFNVSIDGQEPQVIQTSRGTRTFTIARGLTEGTHTIEIFKRTEGNCGVATFKGLLLQEGKNLASPPDLPVRKMEFIGDSITCGYGNMVSTDHPEKFPFTPKNENSALSWGGQTASALGASFMSTSYSGRGVFRNIDGSEAGTLPQLYGVVYPDQPKKAAWDPRLYTPDVIVINLGTNDYSSTMTKTDLGQEEFDAKYAATYKAFIKSLRSVHGAKTKIVCAVGPMMSDYYPAGMSCWTRIQDAVSGLVDELNNEGDKEVFFLALAPQTSPFGEDWHPTVATHSIMSKAAVEFIREITAW